MSVEHSDDENVGKIAAQIVGSNPPFGGSEVLGLARSIATMRQMLNTLSDDQINQVQVFRIRVICHYKLHKLEVGDRISFDHWFFCFTIEQRNQIIEYNSSQEGFTRQQSFWSKIWNGQIYVHPVWDEVRQGFYLETI
jgi:hypothetical protein